MHSTKHLIQACIANRQLHRGMSTFEQMIRERVHPVRIARIHYPRFVPRVGLPRNLFFIGGLTAALRFSKGWVRKDANLGLRTGCKQIQTTQITKQQTYIHEQLT